MTRSLSRGSSPLARGLLKVNRPTEHDRGIIPARAGFTPPTPRARVLGRDHPRSRGVYKLICCRHATRLGSSPLARGLLMEYVSTGTGVRIIPARAGFTRTGWLVRFTAPDHPRSRGVYFPDVTTIIFDEGSSPLARGLPEGWQIVLRQKRIIPARAGFTQGGPSARCHPPDHPRSRGVYDLETNISTGKVGSSPLARGLLRISPSGEDRSRIIPARAGFTQR